MKVTSYLKITRRIKWAALFFFIFFTLNAIIQYSYFSYTFKKYATTQIRADANDLYKQIKPVISDINKYSDIYPAHVGQYIVISDSGFIDVEGKYVPSLLAIKESYNLRVVKRHFESVNNSTGEWRILVQPINDGCIVLGITKTGQNYKIDEILTKDAQKLGTNLVEAKKVHPSKTNQETNYAIFNESGELDEMVGDLPFTEKKYYNEMKEKLEVQLIEGRHYLVYIKPVIDSLGRHQGIIILPDDIEFIFSALNQNRNMNIILAIISLLLFLFIWIYTILSDEKEKKQIVEMFGCLVSPVVLEELLKNRSVLEQRSELKDVTILFVDIRGFTSIAEKLLPQQLTDLLHAFFTEMSEAVFSNNGVVDKFIGDSLMAYWGAPIGQHDRADRAIVTAIEMMTRLKKLQSEWGLKGYPDIDIGIGIHSGQAIVGNLGSDKRHDFTVIGDVVNIASRLQGLNKKYKSNIIISDITRRMLGNQYQMIGLGNVTIRGIENKMKLYKVLV